MSVRRDSPSRFRMILDAARHLRENPRDYETRNVLHDMLLERYGEVYEDAIAFALSQLGPAARGYWTRAVRIVLDPGHLIVAEDYRSLARSEDVLEPMRTRAATRADHRERAARELDEAFRIDYLVWRAFGGPGMWTSRVEPHQIVLFERHRAQVERR